MANWSDTIIELNARSTRSLKKAKAIIEANTDDGWLVPLDKMVKDGVILKDDITVNDKVYFGGGELQSVDYIDNQISIRMSGRWVSPSGFFKKLAKDCNLSGVYVDTEQGADFTYFMEFVNGKCIHEVELDFISTKSIEWFGAEQIMEAVALEYEDDYKQSDSFKALLQCGVKMSTIQNFMSENSEVEI